MTSISVEQLTFTFDPSVVPFQYESRTICVAGWPPASWIANVLLQLRINLVDIDPNPLVLDIARTPAANVPWSVS
jgi:hypothetical protein